jgi:hypothetical protein
VLGAGPTTQKGFRPAAVCPVRIVTPTIFRLFAAAAPLAVYPTTAPTRQFLPPPILDNVPSIGGAPDATGTFLPARFFAPAATVATFLLSLAFVLLGSTAARAASGLTTTLRFLFATNATGFATALPLPFVLGATAGALRFFSTTTTAATLPLPFVLLGATAAAALRCFATATTAFGRRHFAATFATTLSARAAAS